MRSALTRLVVGALMVASIAACSGGDSDDGDNPTPVGGINGPARVDPDSGVANNGGGGD